MRRKIFHRLTNPQVRHDFFRASIDGTKFRKPHEILNVDSHSSFRDGSPAKNLTRMVRDSQAPKSSYIM